MSKYPSSIRSYTPKDKAFKKAIERSIIKFVFEFDGYKTIYEMDTETLNNRLWDTVNEIYDAYKIRNMRKRSPDMDWKLNEDS